MKKQILLVIYMLLASKIASDGAGWNTNAWPSTNHWRFANSTNFVTVTNLYAKYWEVDLHVTNTPDVAGANATLYNWQTGTSWIYSVQSPNTSLWTAVGITNTTFPSNTFTVSNSVTYLTEIQQDYTNHIGYGVTNYYTNIYNVTNLTHTNTITEIKTLRGSGIQTNLSMDVKDLWSWEAYQAIKERLDLQYTYYKGAGPTTRAHLRFYRDPYDNMTKTKGIKDAIVTSLLDGLSGTKEFWVDKSAFTNGTLNDWFLTTTNVPYLSSTGVLQNVNAPSNYFDYTPQRQLGGSGYPYGHTVTSTWTLSVSGDGLTTNTVEDWAGNSWTIVGTNNFTTNVVVTNAAILDGYSTLDYGFKYVDSILNEIVWCSQVAELLVDNLSSNALGTNRWEGYGFSTNSYAEAVSIATTNHFHASAITGPAYGLDIDKKAPTNWTARFISGGNELTFAFVATNPGMTNVAAQVYLKTVPVDFWWVGTNAADFYFTNSASYTNISAAMINTYQYSTYIETTIDVTNAGRWASGYWVGPTNTTDAGLDVPPFPAEPPTNGVTAAGWSLGRDRVLPNDFGHYVNIYKLDKTNSLVYYAD